MRQSHYCESIINDLFQKPLPRNSQFDELSDKADCCSNDYFSATIDYKECLRFSRNYRNYFASPRGKRDLINCVHEH